MSDHQSADCHIHKVIRDGKGPARYWCVSHEASAMARFGGRMPRCEGAYRTVADYKRFQLDPAQFPGGVALWGAVEPVYNTASEPVQRGVHVRAVQLAEGRREINETFEAIELPVRRNLFDQQSVVVTADTAVAYYISQLLDRAIVGLFCPTCHTPHLDSDWYAVKPHRVHLCHGCNRMFKEEVRKISNPLELVQHELVKTDRAPPVRAKAVLDIRQTDFPAGLQIWASTPALLWTSTHPEKQGIRVKGWVEVNGQPKIDGIYGAVRIDGIQLDELQLRVFMAQRALYYLKEKIRDVRCPACDCAVFDHGEAAFRPSARRECSSCGQQFEITGRRKRVVSNPFVSTIKALKAATRPKGEVN